MTDEVRVVKDMWTWPGVAITGQTSAEIASYLEQYANVLPSIDTLRDLKQKGMSNEAFCQAYGRKERMLDLVEKLRSCWVND